MFIIYKLLDKGGSVKKVLNLANNRKLCVEYRVGERLAKSLR